MPDGREPTTVNVLGSITEVGAEEWDACAGADHPFCSYGFLSALEDSGTATAETGWLARHLVVRDEDGRLVASAPLYLKTHSYGEYVFDWGWADAFERAGGRYYPKLQCAVPFTPVTGPRLLVRPHLPQPLRDELAAALMQAMVTLAERLGVSSLHVTFPTEDEWKRLGGHGFLQRTGQQFHWKNRDYRDFDGFLADLASRKRKTIRKERAAVAAHGFDIKALSGGDITEAHWDAFYRFYRDTTDKKWGQNYLNREFFSLLGERMGTDVVMIIVEGGGRPIAGALNIKGGDFRSREANVHRLAEVSLNIIDAEGDPLAPRCSDWRMSPLFLYLGHLTVGKNAMLKIAEKLRLKESNSLNLLASQTGRCQMRPSCLRMIDPIPPTGAIFQPSQEPFS